MVTAAELFRDLAGERGPVVAGYRFTWRDHDYVNLGDVTNAIIDASLDLNNLRHDPINRTPGAGGVLRTARFTLDPALLAAGFDISGDHVGVEQTLLVDGTEETVDMGLFHFDEPEREQVEHAGPDDAVAVGTEIITVDCSDLGIHLQTAIGTPYTVTASTNIATAIAAAIDAVGVGLAHNIPAIPFVTPVERTWGPVATWRQILDTLTGSVNYYPVWPDEQAEFTTKERIPPHTETAAVVYRTDAEPRVIVEPFSQRAASVRFKNQAVVLLNHPKRTAAFALRENTDATSPISTSLITSINLAKVLGPMVIDATAAGEIAEWILYREASRAEGATLRTFPDPRRRGHEVYQLFVDDIQQGTLWAVDGWSLDLEPGAEMTHEIGLARAITITTP